MLPSLSAQDEEEVHGVNGEGSLQFDESVGQGDMHRSVVHRCREFMLLL